MPLWSTCASSVSSSSHTGARCCMKRLTSKPCIRTAGRIAFARVRDLYTIRTPENVTFEFELAGVGARALAWVLDLFVMFCLIMVGACLFSIFATVAGGLAIALLFVFIFLVQWWYSAICEWWLGGQTIGKKLVG